METLGSNVEGMEKILAILEQDHQENMNCVNLLEAHHEELNCKLYLLIDLLSNQHIKGDGMKGHNVVGPSRMEERDSEVDGRGLWSTLPS